MTASYEPTPGDPPDRLRKVTGQHGSTPLPTGYDPAAGTVATGNTVGGPAAGDTAGYPSAPVVYPGTPGQFHPAGQSGGPTGAPYGPAAYTPPPYNSPPYGQSPYATPGYPAPYPPFGAPRRNGLGTAGLVLGIIGVVFCWSPLGFVLGVLAIIFGSVGLGRSKRGEASNRGAAMAGLILGILAIVLLTLLLAGGLSAYTTESSFAR